MVGTSIFVALVLSLFAFEAVSQSATLTLDEVDSQISSFLQLIDNGSISTRGTSSKSLPLSHCALAVRLVLWLNCGINADIKSVQFSKLRAARADLVS